MSKVFQYEKLYKSPQNYEKDHYVNLLHHQQLVINRLSRKIIEENFKYNMMKFEKDFFYGTLDMEPKGLIDIDTKQVRI